MLSPRTLLPLLLSPTLLLAEEPLRTGREAMGDWTTDAPGVRRKITVADLPPPHPEESVKNRPKVVPRPEGAWPKAPAGFKVELFAEHLDAPRVLATAPGGDILVAESKSGRITLLRDADGDGKVELRQVFAKDLKQPFGLAFYPPGPEPKYLYIGDTDAVVRLEYTSGQTEAHGDPQRLVELSSGGQLTGGGHWTRDVVFSPDGQKLFISIGSKSNVDWNKEEEDRSRVFVTDPEGRNKAIYAWGVRNAVGLAIHPRTGELWASTNERDELGNDLVPDYITHLQPGGFYGWPWYYLGAHQDPRHPGERPELQDKVIVPDVLLQAHSASLAMRFYLGEQFPPAYRENAFAALHGSWNRDRRTGYKVIRVPTKDGQATGEYIDFLTGFVTPEGDVWGRPVGVTVTNEGALLVSDDANGTIWRVSYVGE